MEYELALCGEMKLPRHGLRSRAYSINANIPWE